MTSRQRTHNAILPVALSVALSVGVALLVVTGCQKVSSDTGASDSGASDTGASDTGASRGRTVAITITDDGCRVRPASISAGPAKFAVTNSDAKVVNEAELVDAEGRILGERENLTAGLSGTFSLNLQPGAYSVYCPGATTETTRFTVTGEAAASSPAAASRVGEQLDRGAAGGQARVF